MIQEAISKLVSGQKLTRADAYRCMQGIMAGEATEAQIASYVTALRMAGESAEVIAGSAQAMREASTRIAHSLANVVDTCGTGGDGAHTFNISTAAALVTAGAGVPVAKHGNRSVSSKCGSADVLAALGIDITVSAEVMEACLAEIGIAFLFAPSLHPAMKYAIGPRREIAIRTIFNILGPLTNPASAKRGVLGVYSEDLVPLVAKAALGIGAQRMFIVHGRDGLDELTTTDTSVVSEIKNGEISTYLFNPEYAGLPRARPGDLVGGDPEENAAIIRAIFSGEKGPRRDIVVLNAAAAITAGEKADSIKEAVRLAEASIDSGAALEKLESLARKTSGG